MLCLRTSNTIKTEWRVLEIGFHHESRLGRSSLPIRDTLANVSGSPAVNPWIAAGPVHHTSCGLVIPEHTFPSPIGPIIRGASFHHPHK